MPKLDPPFGWHAGLALDEAALHLDGAADRIDHAAELDDAALADALDDAALMCRDCRIGESAAKAPQARERALLVGAYEPAKSDDIGDQNRPKRTSRSRTACRLRVCRQRPFEPRRSGISGVSDRALMRRRSAMPTSLFERL